MRLRGRLTTIPDDLPVPDGTTADVRRVVDNSLLDTITTTDGWYEYAQDGNPGPIYLDWDYADVTKLQYSSITGPSGPVDIAGLPHVFRAWSNGYLAGIGDELVPSATGSSMAVAVGSGAALVQGILYDQELAKNLIVEAAHATHPRVDRIIVRVVPAGAGVDIEGKSELVLLKGTPVAGANAETGVGLPALTQTTSLWEEEIGRVQVDATVPVIASNKVFRGGAQAVGPRGLPNDIVTAATIAAGAVGTSELADGAVTSAKILDGTIATADLADGAVTSAKILDGTIVTADLADNAITKAKMADASVGTAELVDASVTMAKLAASGVDALMPGTEFVATGPISGGTRYSVGSLNVGPLTNGVMYAIFAYFGLTVRNAGSTGTISLQMQINASPVRTHEFQHSNATPRWCAIMQTHAMLGTGTTQAVVGNVTYESGVSGDIRAGWLQVVALPMSILTDGG